MDDITIIACVLNSVFAKLYPKSDHFNYTCKIMDRFCLIPLQINKSAFFAPSEWNMLTLLSRVQDDLTWRDPYLRSTLDWRDGDNYFLISCLHLLSSSSTSSGVSSSMKTLPGWGAPWLLYFTFLLAWQGTHMCACACVCVTPRGVRCERTRLPTGSPTLGEQDNDAVTPLKS